MLGLIGGTGLYKLEGLSGVSEKEMETPFGKASAPVSVGDLAGRKTAFIPRHGKNHQSLPGEINYRANLWALKSVGVTEVISVSACGSLKEEIKPGELVVTDQYFDWTRGKRENSYFGKGIVAHISSADPVCPTLTRYLKETARGIDTRVHFGKTYACVEGPRLGSRAESFFLKRNGFDIVGMTNVPEAFLAREAQLCYVTIGVVTDYDCWLEDPAQHATVDKVIAQYMANIGRVQTLIKEVSAKIPNERPKCDCRKALEGAVLSQEVNLSPENREILNFLRK